MQLSKYSVWLVIGSVLSGWIIVSSTVQAQISPDNLLPTTVTTSDYHNFILSSGSRAGDNLFYSFREFSVPTGGAAIFDNALDIKNIISRVTGNSISNIDGLIKVNGTADLFLLNPNGINFGSKASLQIGGSFVVSTASGILFADGTQLSTTSTQIPPLLTVSTPIGLQFGETASAIRTQMSELRLQSGKTLALVGGNVILEGGILRAPEGRIELGSVAKLSQVRLAPINEGWTLKYKGVRNFQDILLSQGVRVNSSGVGSGDIQVQGRYVELVDNSVIFSNNTGGLDGGARAIFVNAEKLTLRDGSRIIVGAYGEGRSANLTVTADSIELTGTSNQDVSGLFSQTFSSGRAGDLTLNTQQLTVQDGAQVAASTFAAGQGGTVTVNAAESVTVIGRSVDGKFASGLFAQSIGDKKQSNGTPTTGNAGILNINTQQLLVQDGATISVGAINRPDISTGQGGELRINAPGSVTITGTGIDNNHQVRPSTLLAESQGSGAAGNLTIETGKLAVENGAQINVSGTGTGQAGSLVIAADSIRLDNGSNLRAETRANDPNNIAQGSIEIRSRDLVLTNNSNITTNATQAANGGNITIDTGVLALLENSGITANAVKGRGGNIQITTQGLFQSPDSKITASSEQGINGLVDVELTGIDPSQGLTQLPETVDDPSNRIAQGCSTGGGAVAAGQSKFIVTGRGGLPPSPGDGLTSGSALVDLGSSVSSSQTRASTAVAARPTSSSKQLVEAQGWIIGSDGRVILTAQSPEVTPYGPRQVSVNCQEH
ncbi:MAG TPA: filamentous hemagglutinin N-terminal domain-containing protein [Allocoleopsis sp.]